MKFLYLLRHAKSSWESPGLPDHDRPLNERGFRAATVMGLHLAQQGIQPGLILCSSARRALETLDQIRPRLAGKPALEIEKELYAADAGALMTRLRTVDPAVKSALLIGHNPAIETLAAQLIETGAKEDMARLAEKYPTGALCILSLPIDNWKKLAAKGATLDGFITPKDLV
ncbi:SixA phosphatase family protein [Oceanibaculum pacificum]|uniref:Phosphohistidine phosphatase n=1 Tax=Oceanibaculum pacificum TaxID=580166 RepID=A0A154W2D0_9PROT|nr:histidine phosphatase family protein [Oceanibaculum pacificum]KZD07678.1 hypothetical protein AUP43_09890 [Oceanibaculum pacificum]